MSAYKFFRFVLKPLVTVLWPTKVVGKENYEKFGGGLLICNHYSTLDGVIIASKLLKKELNVVIKTEAFEGSKIANWFLKVVGGIPVHRGEADINAVKAVMNVLKNDDKQLLIFPEGTRNKAGTEDMGEFKHGTARFAIKAQRSILPMIYYRKPKTFGRNYLYVGEPFDLSQYYGKRTSEELKAESTEIIYQKMLETRALCNEYVQSLKDKKKKK